MKRCGYCGVDYGKRPSEAYWQFSARRFCSRSCADKGRTRVRVPDEEFKARYRQVKINGRPRLEHRHVVEQALGRPLERHEQVHHKNHNRLDNRLENLEVVSSAEHGLRHTFATHLYASTSDLLVVQRALGHRNISTTEIYTHLVDEALEDALERL